MGIDIVEAEIRGDISDSRRRSMSCSKEPFSVQLGCSCVTMDSRGRIVEIEGPGLIALSAGMFDIAEISGC